MRWGQLRNGQELSKRSMGVVNTSSFFEGSSTKNYVKIMTAVADWSTGAYVVLPRRIAHK